MATGQENINLGTADNANDGDVLRAAFRKVKKMFAEIYGDTDAENLADTETVPSTNFDTHITEKIEDTVDAMFSGGTHNNITVTYDDSDGTLDLSVAADITDVNAGSGLTGVNEDGGAATLNVGAGDGITVNADDVALASSVAGSGLTYTSGVLSVDAIDTAGIADDAVTAAKLALFDDAAVATTTGDLLISDGTDFSNVTMIGDATINSGGTLSLANDVVDHDQLAARYTESGTLTDNATITVAANSKNIYTHTITQATTFNFTGAAIGQVLTLVITGDGSNGITLGTINSNSATFRRIGSGTFNETSAVKNLIEIKFISTSEAWYQISQEAS